MFRAEFNQKTRRLEPVGVMMKKRARAKFSFVIGKTSSQTLEQFNRHITQSPQKRAEVVRIAHELEELSAIAPTVSEVPIADTFDAADYAAFCELFG